MKVNEILLMMCFVIMVLLLAIVIKRDKNQIVHDYTLDLKDGMMYLLNKKGDTIYVSPVDYEKPTPFEHALILDTL